MFKKIRMAVVSCALCGCALAADELEDEFRSPPHPAKPWVYWINMDGHFTKEGITADLESVKVVGIGGDDPHGCGCGCAPRDGALHERNVAG